MRRMQKITGRNDDMIILRGVNLFPTQIEELILGVPELAPQFQCVLDRPERLDRLTVKVESRTGVDDAGRDAAGLRLREQVKNRIGVSVEVQVLPPESIEASTGKAKRLIDNRPDR
jgi:phenylacetate-CoA ligase